MYERRLLVDWSARRLSILIDLEETFCKPNGASIYRGRTRKEFWFGKTRMPGPENARCQICNDSLRNPLVHHYDVIPSLRMVVLVVFGWFLCFANS